MHPAQPRNDVYTTQYPPYEYRYYKQPAAKPLKIHEEYMQQQPQLQQESADPVYGYKISDMSEGDKPAADEEMAEYGQPTLPYYVVPVLYVPKRVLPNEDIQSGSRYTQMQHARPVTPVIKQKYYQKPADESNEAYHLGSYYNNYYDAPSPGAPNDGEMDEDQSYYNMQYAGSSSSVKDGTMVETYTPYQDVACSYSYATKPKLAVSGIRPLKSQPGSLHQEYENKVKAKSRSAYECSRNNQGYYYPDTKDIYYDSLEPRGRVPSPNYDYYSYPNEGHSCDHLAQYKTTKAMQAELNKIGKTPIMQPRYANEENEVGKPASKDEVSKQVSKPSEEKKMFATKFAAKSIVERSTQTVERKLEAASTQTVEEEVKEKKSMIPTSKIKDRNQKVEMENVFSDEEDKDISETMYSMKQTRRNTKRLGPGYLNVEPPEARQQSPLRRQRKF